MAQPRIGSVILCRTRPPVESSCMDGGLKLTYVPLHGIMLAV
jgi:hypothetical protein